MPRRDYTRIHVDAHAGYGDVGVRVKAKSDCGLFVAGIFLVVVAILGVLLVVSNLHDGAVEPLPPPPP